MTRPFTFFARPVSPALQPVMWFAPGLSAHVRVEQGTGDQSVVYVEQDPTFVSTGVENTPQERYRVRLPARRATRTGGGDLPVHRRQ